MVSAEYVQSLCQNMLPQVQQYDTTLSQQEHRMGAGETPSSCRYFYYNHMNRAAKVPSRPHARSDRCRAC